jgi:hypothetical protein
MTSSRKHSAILIIWLTLFSPFSLFSQVKSDKEIPSDCEYVRGILDLVLAQGANIEDSDIILIFRLGKGEKSKKVINRRMEVVRNHINFRKQNLEKFVLAEGEKTNGLGKVEIYIKGKLTEVLFAKKNVNLGYNCLEEAF